MVHVSRRNQSEEMSSHGRNSFMNDSLEGGEWDAAVVAPEGKNGGTDYLAFSTEDPLHLGLFPSYVLNLLQDKSSWKNRVSGVGKLHASLTALRDTTQLESHLAMTVELVAASVSDSHFKVAQSGLELAECLVSKVGGSLSAHLHTLVPSVVVRMGSNKYVIKQAGMRVLMRLMHKLRPEQVLSEAMNAGLQHKTSRVREEIINVIIAALLTFPKSDFHMLSLVQGVAPALNDGKPRVRQACLEAIVLLSHLVDRTDLKQVVSSIASVERKGDGKTTAMNAFHTRLSRQLLPTVNSDGLVEHAVAVAGPKASHSYAGADVDWILSSSVVKMVPESNQGGEQGEPVAQSTSGSVFRPYRSAGKRLPWEMEGGEQSDTPAHAKEQVVNGLPPSSSLAPVLPTKVLRSPMHAGVRVAPLPPPSTARKQGGSYHDIYLTKLSRSLQPAHPPPPTSHPSAGVGSSRSRADSLFVHRSPTHHTTPQRHSSVPANLPANDLGLPHNSLSVTWPRATPTATPPVLRGYQQITADPSAMVGAVRSGVKTNMSRPLSKPRVRHPLSSLGQQLSPSQVEVEFLAGGGEGWEEELFQSIPEDLAVLDSSLSSSLSSLCAGRDGECPRGSEVDKLRHIRKQAASRKAQLLSASNSPDLSGTPPRVASGCEKHCPVPMKRSPEEPRHSHREIDLNATYTLPSGGEGEQRRRRRGSQGKRGVEEPEGGAISLEGHGLGRERDTQPKKKLRKAESVKVVVPSKPRSMRSNSLGGESQRRPSIERGGTNMIEMEVSGVGSPRGSGDPPLSSLSQATKESIVRKRQKQLKDQGEEPASKTHSASYSNSKLPLPLPSNDTVMVTSAPVQRGRQHRHQQAESGYVTAGDETPSNTGGLTSDPGDCLEELHPLASPEVALREAVRALGVEEWSGKCGAMLVVRRLAMFHPEVLSPQLHSVVKAVQEEVRNLRSSVARGAIACFGDLFALMGRAMEQDLDGVVRVLLHKCGESSTFIREDVEKALGEMVANVSPARSLTALIGGGLAHRNVHVRKIMSQLLCVAVEHCGPERLLHSSREVLERTLTAVLQLAGDSAPEARYYGRRCLHQLWPQPEFDRVASRVLSDQLLTRARDTIEILKTKGIGDPPSEPQSARNHGNSSRHPTGGSPRLSSQSTPHETTPTSKLQRKYLSSTLEGAVQLPLPEGLCDRLKDPNWSERLEAISELERFTTSHPSALTPHLVKVFDAFSPRLTDRNSKVNLHALQAFSTMVPLLGSMLVPVVTSVVTALVPNLASRNATIHSTALTVLDLLEQYTDAVHLLQPVASHAQHGNTRVQPIMVKKLAGLAPLAYPHKPQLVTRHALPVLWHMATAKSPPTGEARVAMTTLCKVLYALMGLGLLESASHLSPEHYRLLQETIDNR